MQNNKCRYFLNQKGMTLIEIMIVLVIVGIMGSVLIGNFVKRGESAKVKLAKTQIGELGKALDQYNMDCGSYPTTDQGLSALINPPAGGRACPNWDPGGYLKKMPRDPWEHDLQYQSDGSKYILRSLGKGGQEGGEGYEKDISSEDL